MTYQNQANVRTNNDVTEKGKSCDIESHFNTYSDLRGVEGGSDRAYEGYRGGPGEYLREVAGG